MTSSKERFDFDDQLENTAAQAEDTQHVATPLRNKNI